MKELEQSLKFNDFYRPKKFKDVVGQKTNLITLDNSIKTNQIQNAYIFYGNPGTGKTSAARIYANKLICLDLDENNEPCGKCEACVDYNTNPYIAGVIEIDGASNANINEIRALKTSVTYAPKYKYNVVIIDEVQDVKGPGSSALLKVLEEPPSNTVFLLATTNYDSILEAIKSRCMPLYFQPVSSREIKARLLDICLEQNIKITNSAVELISEGVSGCVRDAVRILQQASVASNGNIENSHLVGLVKTEAIYTDNLINLIIKGDTTELMLYINKNLSNVVISDFDFIAKRFRNALFKSNDLDEYKIHFVNLSNIFFKYKKDFHIYNNGLIPLEFASIEASIYINEKIENKDTLLEIFSENFIKEDNNNITLNKKDIFLNMLYLSNPKIKSIFERYDICLEGDGTILRFLVDTEKDKSKLRKFLSSDIPQKIKHLFEIDGFIVKVKKENQ